MMTGLEAGHKAGLAEGKNIGLNEGKEIGKKETKKELAKKMLELEIPIEQIKEITGLSEDEFRN